MIRILFIIILLVIAFVMFRYRQEPKVQKWGVIGLASALGIYIISIVASELVR